MYSKIGIKAIDINGNSVEIAGDILNSSGDTITHFKSVYAGMGSFMLPVSMGEKYKAIVSTTEGIKKNSHYQNQKRIGLLYLLLNVMELYTIQYYILLRKSFQRICI